MKEVYVMLVFGLKKSPKLIGQKENRIKRLLDRLFVVVLVGKEILLII